MTYLYTCPYKYIIDWFLIKKITKKHWVINSSYSIMNNKHIIYLYIHDSSKLSIYWYIPKNHRNNIYYMVNIMCFFNKK